MGGHKNRLLRVNLTNRALSEESLSKDLIHDYIGGRGFGARLLYDELKPGIYPLGEENKLIFVAGPLAGTNAQAFSRWKVFFKSPLTDTYGMSCCGGHLAAELKFAGFDGIIVEGAADQPVYLWVHDGKYELRDATYLWGLRCDDTHILIREELGDPRIRIACIGPAGEQGVKYSGIFSDRRTAGRGGAGAVMGAKKLKAIATRGNEKVELADAEGFRTAVREQINAYKAPPSFESFSRQGTQAMVELISDVYGMYPTKNFQVGVLPGAQEVGAIAYDRLRVRKTTCYACMIHCGSITKMGTGRHAGAWSEGPEYETIWSFSGQIGVSDIGLTIAADRLCDELGLDTISTGNIIGFAYELYERGLITKKDTGGIELTFGNTEPVLQLIRQIAYREGLGDLLADGVCEAARRIGKGAEEYAMHVKGLELAGYDPRGAKAHGLNMLTANNGGDHESGFASQELFNSSVPKKAKRLTIENKGELTKWNQDITSFMSTGIVCAFAISNGFITPEGYGKLVSAATGVKDFADPDYLWHIGERIFNLERMFNVREGFSRKDDVFPSRFTKVPMPAGPSAGQVFEAERLLLDYYRARDWDMKTGIPTAAKLKELGLGFTIT